VHVISNPVTWYAARAGGVVAYVLLSTSVAFGIALAGRAHLPGLPRFGIEEVHRFLGLLRAPSSASTSSASRSTRPCRSR
jgi:hypothetical protein